MSESLVQNYGVSQEILTMDRIANSVLAGEVNPLDAAIAVKLLKDKLGEIEKVVKEAAFEEALKHPEKTFEFGGVKITKTEGKANYNYNVVPEWAAKKKELESIEEKAKASALNANKGMLTVSEDAEVITTCEITYSKPFISISFK